MKKVRIADEKIYVDDRHHQNPKEYFKLILSEINFLFDKNKKYDKKTIIDVGCANGALLSYLRVAFPDAKLKGFDPIDSLIQSGKRIDSSIDFQKMGLMDIPKLNEEEKADIVISTGVIGIFDNPDIFLAHLLKLVKKNGSIFLFSPFNEDPIDVVMQYRYSGGDIWETGHNLFSLQTMHGLAKKYALELDVIEFQMPFKIEKTDDPMRSWTEPFRDNPNTLIYGTNMFSTMKLLIYKVSEL